MTYPGQPQAFGVQPFGTQQMYQQQMYSQQAYPGYAGQFPSTALQSSAFQPQATAQPLAFAQPQSFAFPQGAQSLTQTQTPAQPQQQQTQLQSPPSQPQKQPSFTLAPQQLAFPPMQPQTSLAQPLTAQPLGFPTQILPAAHPSTPATQPFSGQSLVPQALASQPFSAAQFTTSQSPPVALPSAAPLSSAAQPLAAQPLNTSSPFTMQPPALQPLATQPTQQSQTTPLPSQLQLAGSPFAALQPQQSFQLAAQSPPQPSEHTQTQQFSMPQLPQGQLAQASLFKAQFPAAGQPLTPTLSGFTQPPATLAAAPAQPSIAFPDVPQPQSVVPQIPQSVPQMSQCVVPQMQAELGQQLQAQPALGFPGMMQTTATAQPQTLFTQQSSFAGQPPLFAEQKPSPAAENAPTPTLSLSPDHFKVKLPTVGASQPQPQAQQPLFLSQQEQPSLFPLQEQAAVPSQQTQVTLFPPQQAQQQPQPALFPPQPQQPLAFDENPFATIAQMNQLRAAPAPQQQDSRFLGQQLQQPSQQPAQSQPMEGSAEPRQPKFGWKLPPIGALPALQHVTTPAAPAAAADDDDAPPPLQRVDPSLLSSRQLSSPAIVVAAPSAAPLRADVVAAGVIVTDEPPPLQRVDAPAAPPVLAGITSFTVSVPTAVGCTQPQPQAKTDFFADFNAFAAPAAPAKPHTQPQPQPANSGASFFADFSTFPAPAAGAVASQSQPQPNFFDAFSTAQETNGPKPPPKPLSLAVQHEQQPPLPAKPASKRASNDLIDMFGETAALPTGRPQVILEKINYNEPAKKAEPPKEAPELAPPLAPASSLLDFQMSQSVSIPAVKPQSQPSLDALLSAAPAPSPTPVAVPSPSPAPAVLPPMRPLLVTAVLSAAPSPSPVAMPAVPAAVTPVAEAPRSNVARITITESERAQYTALFAAIEKAPGLTQAAPTAVRNRWLQTGLPVQVLRKTWELCDPEKRGSLTEEEFVLGTHLILQVQRGLLLPDCVPVDYWSNVRAYTIASPEAEAEDEDAPPPLVNRTNKPQAAATPTQLMPPQMQSMPSMKPTQPVQSIQSQQRPPVPSSPTPVRLAPVAPPKPAQMPPVAPPKPAQAAAPRPPPKATPLNVREELRNASCLKERPEIERWLEARGIRDREITEALVKGGVTPAQVPSLTDDRLQELGITDLTKRFARV
eukprot:TRINITY_DN672_c1_g2_i4.p1 TRINITY_DN672_c1_g2~~TRINITY_DN672_c1_g2_i4.p1  ORF type:complete len:1280 (+),score=353.93 TRINITY_DN672_c1_g2_i4:304-3840(+)